MPSHHYNEGTITQYTKEINDFVREQYILTKHLKAFRKSVKDLVPMKEQEMEYYSKFVKFLENYEDGADKVV